MAGLHAASAGSLAPVMSPTLSPSVTAASSLSLGMGGVGVNDNVHPSPTPSGSTMPMTVSGISGMGVGMGVGAEDMAAANSFLDLVSTPVPGPANKDAHQRHDLRHHHQHQQQQEAQEERTSDTNGPNQSIPTLHSQHDTFNVPIVEGDGIGNGNGMDGEVDGAATNREQDMPSMEADRETDTTFVPDTNDLPPAPTLHMHENPDQSAVNDKSESQTMP